MTSLEATSSSSSKISQKKEQIYNDSVSAIEEGSGESSDDSAIAATANKRKSPHSLWLNFRKRVGEMDPWLGLQRDNWNVHVVRNIPRDESNLRDDGFTLNDSTWVGLQGKWRGFFDRMNPPVFIPSAILLLAFLCLFAIKPELAAVTFMPASDWIATCFGPLYLLLSNMLIYLLFFMAVGPTGKMRLGDDDGKPEFGTFSWYAMLFSAGLGIGIIFNGMFEPMTHYSSPPSGAATDEATRFARAVPLSLFDWGFHAWAGYSFYGMTLCYFNCRLKLPCSIRSSLYPLLGKYVLRWPGHCLDILAMFATIFGLCTSLGSGALQINAGLHYLAPGIPENTWAQLIIIYGTTFFALLSQMSGIGKGIRYISNLGFVLLFVLLISVWCINDKDVASPIGQTQQIFDALIGNIGGYINILIERSWATGFESLEAKEWLKNWPVFYIAWGLTWTPFIGMFLANISKNRTIREYVVATLFIPWMIQNCSFTILGTAGVNAVKQNPDIMNDYPQALIFAVFDFYASKGTIAQATATFLSSTAIIVLICWFVSSMDSGSFVIDSLGSGGNPNNPIWQKIFWAVSLGSVAFILIFAGGDDALDALQAVTLILGLPVGILLVIVVSCFLKSIYRDPFLNEMALNESALKYHGKIDYDALFDNTTASEDVSDGSDSDQESGFEGQQGKKGTKERPSIIIVQSNKQNRKKNPNEVKKAQRMRDVVVMDNVTKNKAQRNFNKDEHILQNYDQLESVESESNNPSTLY